MNLQQISERYVNLTDTHTKQQYINQIWEMLAKSYASIGGYKGAASPEELLSQHGLWKLVRRGNEITAFILYRDQHGRKSVAGGTNGTKQGIKDLISMKKADIDLKRAWSEVSGRMEQLMLDLGATPLPNKFAEKLINKVVLDLNPDGIHYTRLIAGEPHEKIILGFPKDSDIAREIQAQINSL